MIQVAPPRPPVQPVVTFDDGLQRVRFRLWQILMAAVTIFITCWFMTFGVMPAIFALLVAKHVLVAILAVGLSLPPLPPKELRGARALAGAPGDPAP